MSLSITVKSALRKAIVQANGKTRLAEKSGVHYSMINRFENGQRDAANMTIGTMEKLFPQILVYFFEEEYPVDIRHVYLPELDTADLTNILMNHWRRITHKQQFEILAHMAEMLEDNKEKWEQDALKRMNEPYMSR